MVNKMTDFIEQWPFNFSPSGAEPPTVGTLMILGGMRTRSKTQNALLRQLDSGIFHNDGSIRHE
jgi:hypothetical protein